MSIEQKDKPGMDLICMSWDRFRSWEEEHYAAAEKLRRKLFFYCEVEK